MLSELTRPELAEVQLSAEDLAAIEALPDADGHYRITWTPRMDAILLRTWKTKRKSEVAEFLGVSDKTARARYKELTNKGDEQSN